MVSSGTALKEVVSLFVAALRCVGAFLSELQPSVEEAGADNSVQPTLLEQRSPLPHSLWAFVAWRAACRSGWSSSCATQLPGSQDGSAVRQLF